MSEVPLCDDIVAGLLQEAGFGVSGLGVCILGLGFGMEG